MHGSHAGYIIEEMQCNDEVATRRHSSENLLQASAAVMEIHGYSWMDADERGSTAVPIYVYR